MQTDDEVGQLDGNDTGLCSVAGFNSSVGHEETSHSELLFRDANTQLIRQMAAEYSKPSSYVLRRHLPAERRITTGTFICVAAVCN
jgi:hypothetical protein